MATNIPWLPSSEGFLRAIIAGSQAGAQAADRQASRFRGGGGSSFDPLDQARTDALRAKMAQEQADIDAKNTAFGRQSQLIGMGVSPQEAFAEAGLSRFGIDAPDKAVNPWQTLSLGNGEVARVNSATGEMETLQGARPESGLRATMVDTSGMTPEDVAFEKAFNPSFGVPRLSGSPSAISNYMAQAGSPAPVAQPASRIKVKSPDGKIGTISASALQEALASGYTQVQ